MCPGILSLATAGLARASSRPHPTVIGAFRSLIVLVHEHIAIEVAGHEVGGDERVGISQDRLTQSRCIGAGIFPVVVERAGGPRAARVPNQPAAHLARPAMHEALLRDELDQSVEPREVAGSSGATIAVTVSVDGHGALRPPVPRDGCGSAGNWCRDHRAFDGRSVHGCCRRHSQTPGRQCVIGRNIDNWQIVAGTTMLNAMPFDGAMFRVGDPPASQGVHVRSGRDPSRRWTGFLIAMSESRTDV